MIIDTSFRWDEPDVSDFFNYDMSDFQIDPDEGVIGRLYRASDDQLRAEVLFLPDRGVVCFTILDRVGRVIVDLSVHPLTDVTRKREGSTEYLYIHECTVLPGIRAYRDVEWFSFRQEVRQAGPVLVSVRFTCAPHISLQLLDVAPENRAA